MKSSCIINLGCVLAGLAAFTLFGCDSGGGATPAGTGGQTVSSGGTGGSQSSGGTVGSGGVAGSGGSIGSGGSVGSGGATSVGGSGGTIATSGGTTGSGGTIGSGGATETGGQVGTGGSPGTGGRTNTGGRATGGSQGTGGLTITGGTTGTGGSTSGATATGGRGTGGLPGTGGRATGGTTGTGGTTAAGGSTGTGACPHVQMAGTDICTIGDSWIQMPGNQVTTLENHMVSAGVIPSGAHFDRREVSGSTLSSIIGTYTRKPSNCKILVMDGGGIDLFSTPLDPSSSAVTNIVNQFKTFLQTLKTDGYVQHIIYSLYPVIPSTKNLNANMGPGFSAACAASAVDCHLVDLEPLFKGQHFASDNTHADNAGGVIIGDAWWKAMQENCIAQ